VINKLSKLFFNLKLTIFLLVILGLGAAIATFIENDFGTISAFYLVYDSFWYEFFLLLTIINLIGIIFKFKMWKNIGRFTFHSSFVVILFGAFLTRYFGYEVLIPIKEGETVKTGFSTQSYISISIKHKNKTINKYYPFKMNGYIKELNFFNKKFDFNNHQLFISYKDFKHIKMNDNKVNLAIFSLKYNGKEKTVKVAENKNYKHNINQYIEIEDLKILINISPQELILPFKVKLNDFKLTKYVGTNSASSYESNIVVYFDKKEIPYNLYMNNVLEIGNYTFFQSSYFPDETGTLLSLNNDPGKWITYLGYFLLIFGFLLNFFSKSSRFRKLITFLKENKLIIIFSLILFNQQNEILANDDLSIYHPHVRDYMKKINQQKEIDIKNYITFFEKNYIKSANTFSKLYLENNNKKILIDSFNKDLVYKITGKKTLFNLNHNQIILSMISKPEIWELIKIIKIKHHKIKKIFKTNDDYISFKQVFSSKNYLLKKEVSEANLKKPFERGTFEKEIIKLDEKLNILNLIFQNELLRIFPNNSRSDYKLYSPKEFKNVFQNKHLLISNIFVKKLYSSFLDNNFEQTNKYLNKILLQQQHYIKYDKNLVEKEIEYNKLDIFYHLFFYFLVLSILFLFFSILNIINNYSNKYIYYILFGFLLFGFLLFTFGGFLRYQISGYVPWSNLYESLLFISWSSIFAGILFFRKQFFLLASSSIVASIFLFVANLSEIDTQITNLVPVLKSYWLSIHVSIITSSYGFFSISFIIGLTCLFLYLLVNIKPEIKNKIKVLSVYNEISLIFGLILLTIGNFLGGVWANESWGRYWAWDPKETWAYISIICYVIVLHLRFVPKLNNPYVITIGSIFAYSSILMTYIGVNFYLSGLHSYATGDPFKIPLWTYYLIFSILLLMIFSFKNRKLVKKII